MPQKQLTETLPEFTDRLGDKVLETGPEWARLSQDSSRYHPSHRPLAAVLAPFFDDVADELRCVPAQAS